MVLNSLSDTKLHASTRCVAPYGRFIEIGRYDMMVDTGIGMGMFKNNTGFHGVDLDLLLQTPDHPDLKRSIALLLAGLEAGVVQPLPTTIFAPADVEKAFRFMAQGKHIGKVLVGEPVTSEVHDQADPRLALHAQYFSSDATYLITGGLGGFGLQVRSCLSVVVSVVVSVCWMVISHRCNIHIHHRICVCECMRVNDDICS